MFMPRRDFCPLQILNVCRVSMPQVMLQIMGGFRMGHVGIFCNFAILPRWLCRD